MFDDIEGATPIDPSGLIQTLRTQSELNLAESENILTARRKYFRRRRDISKWFNESFLLRVHRDMFGRVWEWAGKFRKHQTNIGTQPYRIPLQLKLLCEDVQFCLTEPHDVLDQAARIHHRLVLIHPFDNGNGRFSRFISDLYLYCSRFQIPRWPMTIDTSENSIRKQYLDTLRALDQTGDYSELINLMKNYGSKQLSR